ncbi:MAG: sigma-70 family RNA polymerase sigma factor [Pirellulaceae bacterium]|nr:sigma-70 family RNA polymerase sigma factor [Pirellulaceae bacterium]
MSSEPVPTTASDEELACRAQRGCAESFDCLLRKYQAPVLHFLRHRGGNGDAEDLAQETFLRAYENLHRYAPRWSFSAWLFTIARRASINHHRRARPAVERSDVDSVASAGAEPLDAMVAAEGRRRLWDAAARVLDEEQTTALWLHYVEGMPARGIALVLGRSVGSVKVMMFRARKKLLPLLAEFDDNNPTEKPKGKAPGDRRVSRSEHCRAAVPGVEK